MYAVLLLAKGENVLASDIHNAWVAWMVNSDPEHDSLVPFEFLSAEVQKQDEPYVEAIKATWRKLNRKIDASYQNEN